MEKITYRLTLDTFKGGIQKVLRGVYTGDVLSRRVAISLSAGSVPCKISDEESSVSAVMYVTKPSGVTNYGNCEIVDNVVYYDIIQYDVDVEGIVEMQLKVMSEDSVLYAPVFALEVQQSKNSDTIAEQSPQFTALEAALARAEEVYRKRLVSIELTDDLVFIAHYGDNSTYESDAIKNALAFVDDAERARVIAENERVFAEEQRVLAELERVLAEQRRNFNYDNLWTSLNEVIEDTEELQRYVESLVEEGFITESRVLELIEQHGGGAVPDNVLVASEESAQIEPAPKVNADLFGGKAPSDFASADDIEDITNGTTQVGNAKTLDGHGAEYFGKSSEVTSLDGGKRNEDTNVADYRQKMVFIGLKEGAAINLPVHPYSYVFGLQGWSDQTGGTAHELAFNDMGIYRRRIYDDNAKTNWTKISDSDDLANYLPLTGGNAKNFSVDMLDSIGQSGLAFRENGGILQYLTYDRNTGVLKRWDTDFTAKTLLDTGNKPTGTYTGNGDATERIINTNGLVKLILVTNNENYDFVLVCSNGYFGKQGNTFVSGSDAFVYGASLAIKTTSPLFNTSGVVYNYSVL